MGRSGVVRLAAVLLVLGLHREAPPASSPSLGRLRFEPNRGQADARVLFLARLFGRPVSLTRDGAYLGRAGFRFVGARSEVRVEGAQPLPSHSQYFLGNRSYSSVPHFARVEYSGLYPGVDAVFRDSGGRLEYDFAIAPGAEPESIALAIDGRLRVDGEGALVVESGDAVLTLRRPLAYQLGPGGRQEVAVDYRLRADNTVALRLGPYDHTRSLVIDPEVAYASYLGGRSVDSGASVAVDSAGNVYVVGRTGSTDFPGSSGAPLRGLYDAYVAKLNPAGNTLVWATYLGGGDVDEGRAIAVDANGAVHVVGVTASTDFPLVAAAQPTFGGKGVWLDGDAFYARLDAATGQQLSVATYLGGSIDDEGTVVAADGQGGAWIAGDTYSTDFPTQAPFQAAASSTSYQDGFVAHLDASGALVLSSYLGGSNVDHVHALAVDGGGRAWVAGETASADFPTHTPFQATLLGVDAFLTRIDGGAIGYSTFFGGSYIDIAHGVAVDGAGNAYLAGETQSDDLPLAQPLQSSFASASCGKVFGCPDAFVAKFDGSTLVYSTYLGGGDVDVANGIAVDGMGRAQIAGFTDSIDFPVQSPFQAENGGGIFVDAFVARLSAGGDRLLGASYFGGRDIDIGNAIAVAGADQAVMVGNTDSNDLPTKLPLQAQPAGVNDAFVAKIVWDSGGPLSVTAIRPAAGGDTGLVSALIQGSGFLPDATARLKRTGQPDIVGTALAVDASGTAMTATFDLRGQERGRWDVEVGNPNGAPGLLSGAFTIEEGRPPEVICHLIGPARAAFDRPTHYWLELENRGNVNAYGAYCILTYPPDTEIALDPEPPMSFPEERGVPNARTVTLQPPLPPGARPRMGVVMIHHRREPPSARIEISSGSATPASAGGANADCFLNLLSEAVNVVYLFLPPGATCAGAVGDALISSAQSNGLGMLNTWLNQQDQSVFTIGQLISSAAGALLSCAGSSVGKVPEVVNVVLQGIDVFNSCKDWDDVLDVLLALSADPNAIAGPAGVGAARYVTATAPLAYAIDFENRPEATAPAQQVVVTVPIDPNLDPATFELGTIRVGNRELQPPPGTRDYHGRIDMRSDQQVIVEVTAHLDTAAQLASWTLRAIDPLTGAAPTDPFTGFLPPNTSPPAGQGTLEYSVAPHAGAASGTTMKAQARIIFDANAAIDTEVWENAVDATLPASRIDLAASVKDASFTVRWAGADDHAGVKDYSILVSEDGVSYRPWQTNTDATSAVFNGRSGASYSFRSQARDGVGNRELATSQVTTHVGDGCGCAVGGRRRSQLWLVGLLAVLVFRRRRFIAAPCGPAAAPRRGTRRDTADGESP